LKKHSFFRQCRRPGNGCCIYGLLTAQHQRGRELTDYILAGDVGATFMEKCRALARVMESLVRMYEHHAAIERHHNFSAWKQSMT